MQFEAIQDDFAFLDDWEDRYRYVIDLGRDLPELPDEARTEANKVRGCVSQVWLLTSICEGVNGGGPVMSFVGDSDAMIVRGLIAILRSLYCGRTAHDVLAIDAEARLAALGLRDHLTPQRSNGLASMVARIRADAQGALDGA